MTSLICLILAYLIGSLSTAIILAKLTGKSDPRDSGSGNAGATNVLRTQGKQQAIIVLIGDLLKGVIAVWFAHAGNLSFFMEGMVAVAVVLGHIFPVYFKFKGGKGVATALGATLMLSLWAAIIVVAVWLIVVFVKRYISLASICAAGLLPFVLFLFGAVGYFIPGIFMGLLVIWKHKGNIERLKAGTEPKYGS